MIGIVFSSFSNMKVCCVFSLESPRGGDSNEYTQHLYQYKKTITRNNHKYKNVCSYGIIFVMESKARFHATVRTHIN